MARIIPTQERVIQFDRQFKPGQAVLYVPRNADGFIYKVEPGIVKRQEGGRVFVWFHEGCTASGVRVEELRESIIIVEHTKLHHGCEECVPPIDTQAILEMLRREP